MIRLHRVTHRYDSGVEALRDLTVELREGELSFIAGRTGSGKTTLMRLLAGDLTPTSGTVVVGGHDVGTLTRRSRPAFRRQIGRLWQDFRLLPDRSVRDNVAFPLVATGLSRARAAHRVDRALETVAMTRFADATPDWLSDGERQRAAIARALVMEPRLILADEPTGNLDAELEAEILQILTDVRDSGTTLVIATFDVGLAERFGDRTVVLNRGFVIDDDELDS